METPAPWTSGMTTPPIPLLMDRDREERQRQEREEQERRRREEAEERRRQIEEDRKRIQNDNEPTDWNDPKGRTRR